MQIRNQRTWDAMVQNNTHSYGSEIIRFSERWADLMEEKMASGARLKDIAEETSYEAGTEGINPWMFGHSLRVLVKCWKHGNALRRWYNSKFGMEGKFANWNGMLLIPFHIGGLGTQLTVMIIRYFLMSTGFLLLGGVGTDLVLFGKQCDLLVCRRGVGSLGLE